MSISDAYGCGSTIPIIIQLINSPKYFNQDNFNDTWNITDMPNQDDPLYVFDRYGKLLKQLYPNGPGWMEPIMVNLPADDYWFYISYLEKGILKEYRSHFHKR
jgi:gliding motility-associated-like protein